MSIRSEKMRLLLGVILVRPRHAQKVLGYGQVLPRNVNIQRVAFKGVALDGVGIGNNDRKPAYQLDRLADNVFNGGVVGLSS
jgi:hypothetical protein